MSDYDPNEIGKKGMSGSLAEWLEFNLNTAFSNPAARQYIAAFPPVELMENTSGLTDERDFTAHGVAILTALQNASPIPLNTYKSVLDFGSGVGRVARMFKGFAGQYTGVDIDARHVEWMKSALPYVRANLSQPRKPLPFEDGVFDCVISISVFTHMNETDQDFYLSELRRVCRPGSYLFLTVHGSRALDRAISDQSIFDMLSVPRKAVVTAHRAMKEGPTFKFIRQDGHLTSGDYEYGITFISDSYVSLHWSKFFSIERVVSGAIHDFQDIVVCRL